MFNIALRLLSRDRTKFFAIIIGITFSSLIMTQQPAIFIGLMSRTYSYVHNLSGIDIWAMNTNVEFIEKASPMRDVELLKVRGIKGVDWAAPLIKVPVKTTLPDGRETFSAMNGIDNATLIGAPYQILDGKLADFRRIDGVFVDSNAANSKLRVKTGDNTSRSLIVGDTLELNNKQAVVVGIVKMPRNFTLESAIYTSYSNALNFLPEAPNKLNYILIKAKKGFDHEELVAKIKKTTALKAFTSKDFENKNFNYWMQSTGIPINFGVSVLLGFIVGAVIVSEIFYGFVIDNLKNYAVLKAMGLSNRKIVKIVVMQALIVGFIGYGIGVGIAALFGLYFIDATLAYRLTPSLLLFSATGVFLIITLTALIAIHKITDVDPSTVFRE
jgi:putative ABC transport system permease protein